NAPSESPSRVKRSRAPQALRDHAVSGSRSTSAWSNPPFGMRNYIPFPPGPKWESIGLLSFVAAALIYAVGGLPENGSSLSVSRTSRYSADAVTQPAAVLEFRGGTCSVRAVICPATPPRSPQRNPRNGAGAGKLRGCDRPRPAHPEPRLHRRLQRRAVRPVRGKTRCHWTRSCGGQQRPATGRPTSSLGRCKRRLRLAPRRPAPTWLPV